MPRKKRDMSRPLGVQWSNAYGFKPFGDRLDFLSPEVQHLNTGRLRIMPPANPEKRNGSRASE